MQGTDPLLQNAYIDESVPLDASQKNNIKAYLEAMSGYGYAMLGLGGLKKQAGEHMLGTVGTLNADSSMMYWGHKK